MSFNFSLTASAEYTNDAPTLEILLDGIIVSSQVINNLTADGGFVYNFSLDYTGTLPPFEIRFNDAQSEASRTIHIENVSINGQTLDQNLFGLNGNSTLNGTTLILSDNGASSNLNPAVKDYVFGINEPVAPDFGAPTHAGTTGNDTALKASKFDDVIYGDAGHDKISGLNGNDLIFGGDGSDTLLGHGGNDVIVGGENNDRLYGRDGDDILYGGNGHDRLEGDAGQDILNGGDGDDRLEAGAGDDTVYGGSGKDKIFGGDGVDTIYGDSGLDTVYAGNGDDIIDGGADKDWLYGEAGNDTIHGGLGTDRLFGGDGNDTLNGGLDQDHLYGGDGNDIMDGGDQKDWLYGHAGDDTLIGGAGKDRLLGGIGNDTLTGDGGNDILYGEEGNDTLDGGQGDDILYASLDGTYTEAVTVSSVLAADSFMFYNADTGNFYKHITTGALDTTHTEALSDLATQTLHGGSAHLATISSASEQAFIGTMINSSLWAWVDGSDSANEGTFTYESGPESGSVFDNSLSWQAGTNSGTADNVLIWDGGGDVLYAYAGTNDAYGYIAEWEGTDVLTSGGVTSGYDSTLETNILNGGIGNDTLYGAMGSDILNGGADNDTLDGGAGIDTASYVDALGNVNVHLGTGAASGADGNDTLISIENVTGGDHDDTLTGNSGANILHGGSGADTILGGGGNDTLHGGDGNDVIGSNSVSNSLTVSDILSLNSNLAYSTETGNFYEFISSAADWNTANSAAQASTLNGVAGHLVTINSATEQTFISTVAATNSHFWSGGTDSGTEDQWEWTAGAEAGTTFWNGSGSTGEYTNWYQGNDITNNTANNHTLILSNSTYSNEWYAYTATYSAAYMIEWEGADIFARGLSINQTSNTVSLYGGDGQDTLYGGTGIDRFVFESDSAFNDIDFIENFVSGAGGDALDLSDLLSGFSGPITDWVNLVESGNNTLVQVDTDGTANGTNFTTIAQINDATGLDEATLHANSNIIV